MTPLVIMRSLIVTHSVRSFFSASHPRICWGTFSTVSPEILKSRIHIAIPDFNLSFPRKNGHMIKFHEGAFHTALGSCTLMPNDSSDDCNTLPRTQRYSASPPASYGTLPMDQLRLERTKERLHIGIIITIATPAHTRNHAVFS